MPGVDEGLVPLIESPIYMQGIYRLAEAANKAHTKLARMAGRYKVEWVSTDIGIALQRGRVLQLSDPSSGIDQLVLVESVQMISYGRYRVRGSNYSPGHYPSDIIAIGGYGLVPVGAILPIKGETIPAGWAEWTAANGKFIKGSTTGIGSTGGNSTITPPVLTLDTGTSGHGGASKPSFLVNSLSPTGGGLSGFAYTPDGYSANSGGHATHTVTPEPFDPNVYRIESKYIIKTGVATASIPKEAIVFGLPDITQALVGRYIADAGRLIKAASSRAQAGASGPDGQFKNTSGVSFPHDHWTRTTITGTGALKSSGAASQHGNSWYTPAESGASHSHVAWVVAEKVLKDIRVPMYWSGVNFKVSPGFIFAWSGSLLSLPADYTLCDGTLGTPDVHDYFIKVSPVGEEFYAWEADSAIIYGGGTNNAGSHAHRGASGSGSFRFLESIKHGGEHSHLHSVNPHTQAWEPPFYTLAFIMYNPSPA